MIRSNQGTSLNLEVADRDENLSQAAEPRTAEPGAAIFVWGGWAVMTAVAVAFVVSFGPNLPRWDDFAMVDVLVGTTRDRRLALVFAQ